MKNKYLCPYCKGHLEVEENIVISAKTSSGKIGLIFLSPCLGNYTVVKHPNFDYEDGEEVDMFCPICGHNLYEKSHNNSLARIIMIDKNDKEHDILFSRIAGEKCTYKITEGQIEKYGDDENYFVMPSGVIARRI
ncbi:MAG: hypothetical protein K9H64_21200 [Bacteroidales bacterium]|nr:hypothetical protein [Bacteroidales bacterium]MCF8458557.1 hypothetical protein [Bacteroidales bacterium]